MGCTSSKDLDDDSPEATRDREEAKNRQQSELLRKQINDIYTNYKAIKIDLKPLISEKIGLQIKINDERNRLLKLMTEKETILEKRDKLLDTNFQLDAVDIYNSFGKFSMMDKSLLLTILINRTNWQMQKIASIFEQKFGSPLLAYIINEMQTLLGKYSYIYMYIYLFIYACGNFDHVYIYKYM